MDDQKIYLQLISQMLFRKKHFFVALILLTLLSVPAVWGGEGPISVETKVSRNKVPVGENFEFMLIIKHQPEVTVKIPLKGTGLGLFTVKAFKQLPTTEENGQKLEVSLYSLGIDKVGKFKISPISVKYSIGNQPEQEVFTKGTILEGVKEKVSDKIYDIRPPKELASDYRPWYYLLGGILGVILLGLGIKYLRGRFKRAEIVIASPPPPPLPPEVEARGALKELKRRSEEELINKKEFYSDLSEVIRCYLGRRYGFESLEETSEELMADLEKAELTLEVNALIEELITASDLVKFARFSPKKEVLKRGVDTGYEIVEKTTVMVERLNDTSGKVIPVETALLEISGPEPEQEGL